MTKSIAVAIMFATLVAPAGAQTSGTAPIEVPLSVHGGRLVVPVEAADGSELQFVLSSGSGQTVFTDSLAAKLGDSPRLSMGGAVVPTDAIHTVEDEELLVDGRQLAGMIGANMLNQFDVLVDVPGGRLILKPTGRSVDWEGVELSEPVRVLVLHGIVLSFDVELEGRRYPATLDLGTPMLVVNEGVQADTLIEDEDEVTLSLGGARLSGVPVRVLDLEILRRWSPDGDGFVMVGAPLAYDCAISISWVHREIRTCVR